METRKLVNLSFIKILSMKINYLLWFWVQLKLFNFRIYAVNVITAMISPAIWNIVLKYYIIKCSRVPNTCAPIETFPVLINIENCQMIKASIEYQLNRYTEFYINKYWMWMTEYAGIMEQNIEFCSSSYFKSILKA